MAAHVKAPHFMYPDKIITIALYQNTDSCKELRKCVMAGDLEVALLKAELVIIYSIA